MTTILILDDDPDIRLLCVTALQPCGYRVCTAASPAEARAVLHAEPVDLFIVDVLLGPTAVQRGYRSPTGQDTDNGLVVAQRALEKYPELQLFFITSHCRMTLLTKGLNPDRWPVLQKPFSPTVLRTEVSVQLLAHEKVREEARTRPGRLTKSLSGPDP